MAKPEVLSRVDADLENGRTRLATRRLADFLTNDPQDLEVRARLADAYRRAGELAEAGRWAFLTEDAEPHEIAAFARKYRSAADRLRLLGLRGENPRELGPLAGPRYTDLVAVAATEVTAPPNDPKPVRRATPAPAVQRVPAADKAPAVKAALDLGWSCGDILLALAVFGPGAVVVIAIVYEIVMWVYDAQRYG